jgi:hypothetical protein
MQAPLPYNGRIFVASEDGDVYVIDAGPQFASCGRTRWAR